MRPARASAMISSGRAIGAMKRSIRRILNGRVFMDASFVPRREIRPRRFATTGEMQRYAWTGLDDHAMKLAAVVDQAFGALPLADSHDLAE